MDRQWTSLEKNRHLLIENDAGLGASYETISRLYATITQTHAQEHSVQCKYITNLTSVSFLLKSTHDISCFSPNRLWEMIQKR